MTDPKEIVFTIPLSKGRVARVPLSVLEQYVVADAASVHAPDEPSLDDVTAHNLTLSERGTAEWHIAWELGQCTVTDASGFPREYYAWHRHPYGTEYAELYEG
ncbi:MAG: hypothetical protein IT373_00100 [Polyangiaceae bacterium]|nr:hypothetical protein [Polyangiaceae bacterium]